jgi:GntR family transcriptional regulator/MocR family aminotransferase
MVPGTPRFLQLARGLAEEIRRGRLRPGDALPGSRALAKTLSVHRNTVLAAYRELAAEGWIVTEEARGTFVSGQIPDVPARRIAGAPEREGVPPRAGFDLPPAPGADAAHELLPGTGGADAAVWRKKKLLAFSGSPDVRLVPIAELARAYRRVLRQNGKVLLDYGDPAGSLALREALAAMLSATRGLAASAESIVVTRGSQMALDLVGRALFSPGDVVAVEALGYRPAWDALRAAGAELVPLPLDASGLVVEALEALTKKMRVRGVYVTPHHQYPTTVGLAAGRRLELLDLARRSRFAILEDDYDHEFHYDGRPLLPLASADRAGVVVYIGTLSKILAPGLRIGYVVAPPPVVERIARARRKVDRQGDHAVEAAVAELLEDGEILRHVRRAPRVRATARGAREGARRVFRGGARVRSAGGGHVPVGRGHVGRERGGVERPRPRARGPRDDRPLLRFRWAFAAVFPPRFRRAARSGNRRGRAGPRRHARTPRAALRHPADASVGSAPTTTTRRANFRSPPQKRLPFGWRETAGGHRP